MRTPTSENEFFRVGEWVVYADGLHDSRPVQYNPVTMLFACLRRATEYDVSSCLKREWRLLRQTQRAIGQLERCLTDILTQERDKAHVYDSEVQDLAEDN